MTQITKHSELKYAFVLFNAMVKDNLGYIYRGSFNDDITDSILELTEVSLVSEEQSSKIKKRVYAIMVEGLQNITRHQDSSPDVKGEHKSIFVIQKLSNKYFITTGNIIENHNIANIKNLIKKINLLDKDELKTYYKQVLEEGTLSNKGGAGLGLIDMARKSGNRLSYHFKTLSNDLSFFYLHTIPSLESSSDVAVDGKSNSLDRIVKTHDILNREEVMMIFNGNFNHESYTNILLSLQKNITEIEDLKNNLNGIISEMLKNIVKHGAKLNDSHNGNPGIFYVSQLKDSYLITTGNYIKNSVASDISSYITNLNESSDQDIKEQFLAIDDTQTDPKSGLLSIRAKTNYQIHFTIKETDKDYSFLSLRVKLKP